MKRFIAYCIFITVAPFILFAGICDNCGFKNDDSERYCINCFSEIRKLSLEEKEKLSKINALRKKTSDDALNRQIKQEIKINKARKQNLKKKQNKNIGISQKSALFIKGAKITLGMKKNQLRNRIQYSSSRYPYDGSKWKINDHDHYCYLYFNNEEELIKWESTIHFDYYIERDFPLKLENLKTGMVEKDVIDLFGKCDKKHEIDSKDLYLLKLTYYIDEPRSELNWHGNSPHRTHLRNYLYKIGKTIELSFDRNGNLLSFKEVQGTKRRIDRPLMNPII